MRSRTELTGEACAKRIGSKIRYRTDCSIRVRYFLHCKPGQGSRLRQRFSVSRLGKANLESTVARDNFAPCIAACNDCAITCNYCIAACLQENDVALMARCIAKDIDCAAMCQLAAAATARGSKNAPAFRRPCGELCKACGDECAKYDVAHCQACAKACYACAASCGAVLA